MAYVCGTHTIGNYVQDFVKLPDKALLNAVQNVSLSELANLIFGGNFTTAKLAEFVKNTVNGNETDETQETEETETETEETQETEETETETEENEETEESEPEEAESEE